jgi:hypothetical protein
VRYPWWHHSWFIDDCWFGPTGGFRIGWHSRHWSIWLGEVWPTTCYGWSSPVCFGSPVVERRVIYEPVPVVRVLDPYDDVDALIDALKYGSVEQRRAAAKELAYQDTARAIYPLVYALEYDEDATVRYLAARSLGKLGYRDALEALRKAAAGDPDEVVRSEAQDSIDLIVNG